MGSDVSRLLLGMPTFISELQRTIFKRTQYSIIQPHPGTAEYSLRPTSFYHTTTYNSPMVEIPLCRVLGISYLTAPVVNKFSVPRVLLRFFIFMTDSHHVMTSFDRSGEISESPTVGHPMSPRCLGRTLWEQEQ